MKINEIIRPVKKIIQSHTAIKLGYLFGSQITGGTGAMSDFDFAFYVEGKDIKKIYDLKFILMDEISLALKSDRADIVILNLIDSPELKYNIIRDGTLFYSVEPYQVLIEPRILNEYFDFHSLLVRHNLAKSR